MLTRTILDADRLLIAAQIDRLEQDRIFSVARVLVQVDLRVLDALFFGNASAILVPIVARRTAVRTGAVLQLGVSTDRADVRDLAPLAGAVRNTVRQRHFATQLGASQLLFVTTAHALVRATFVGVIILEVLITTSVFAILANCGGGWMGGREGERCALGVWTRNWMVITEVTTEVITLESEPFK